MRAGIRGTCVGGVTLRVVLRTEGEMRRGEVAGLPGPSQHALGFPIPAPEDNGGSR